MSQGMAPDRVKAGGIHYTPVPLASFLAEMIERILPPTKGAIHVLDPACGDGGLLLAFADAVPKQVRQRLVLTGYETDRAALDSAATTLKDCAVADIVLKNEDFLSASVDERPNGFLPFEPDVDRPQFDVVIANPPYVRTQVLGASASQKLAGQFGLTGRVDLYHAFTVGMTNVLRPGGVLGLLTSNRFFSTNAGASLRRMLRTEYRISDIYDLGDTKLFTAAVLPAIIIASKGKVPGVDDGSHFARVYEARNTSVRPFHQCSHVLDAMSERATSGLIETPQGTFLLERGSLLPCINLAEKWTLSTPEFSTWLALVDARKSHIIDELATVKVGIKTTADKVFVRKDWHEMAHRPEQSLLHPLITHHNAERWKASSVGEHQVLYPYDVKKAGKKPVPLDHFPKAKKYLSAHEEHLKSRKYVIDAGRKWYEIWVPQIPSQWSGPKVVFPDIAESPRFLLDTTGAIVQGDCYWIGLKKDVDPDWLFVILAVSNSSFIEKYYDVAFHNKLYSGRRRFMTQYVKRFPLPPLKSKPVRRMIEIARTLSEGKGDLESLEAECNELVWKSFT